MILEFAAKGKKTFAFIMLALLYLETVIPSYALGERIYKPAVVPVKNTVVAAPALSISEKGKRKKVEDLGGPTQPESQAFHSVSDANMVDLFTGDFSYSIPLLDVGGYPVALGYSSGISMDQEPSWVGLGWNVNPGTITRNMRGVPDEFDGTDTVRKVADIKDNTTTGGSIGVGAELFGLPKELLKVNGGYTVGLFKNSYKGWGIESSVNVSLDGGSKTMGTLSGGLSLTNNSQDGLTVGASLSAMMGSQEANDNDHMAAASASVSSSYNTRSGLKALQLSAGIRQYAQGSGSHANDNMESTFGTSISFAHPSYTPTITLPYTSNLYSFSGKVGGELAGVHVYATLSGYTSSQGIKDADTALALPAYGYLNYQMANGNPGALLDYNREKDMPYREKPSVPTIAIPAYTYDVFSVTGEGSGGMFRAYRGDIGYMYDHHMKTKDKSLGGSVDLGLGNAFHLGVDIFMNHAYTENNPWTNLNGMAEQVAFRKSDKTFEASYFRNPGEKAVNNKAYYDLLGGDDVVAVKLFQSSPSDPNIFARNVLTMYRNKKEVGERALTNRNAIKTSRDKRTQVISYLTATEASTAGLSKYIDNYKLNTYSLQPCDQNVPQDTDANKQGLWGDYFIGTNFDSFYFSRIDTVINFSKASEINLGRPANLDSLNTVFSVRLKGRIKADVTGTYQFITRSDDGIRLFINDTPFINRWTDHPDVIPDTANVNLVAGQLYNIRVEYYQRKVDLALKLQWKYAGLPTRVIPRLNLYVPLADSFQVGNVYREKRVNDFRKGNHISEMSVLNADGRRYVYGIPVYNLKQKDVTFSVDAARGDNKEGLVKYTPGVDNTAKGNKNGKDNYFSSEQLPAYAHSFLLTAILSPDYVDITGDGISPDDPGDAIKFNYSKVAGLKNPYKWRAPYKDSATYSEGLKTDNRDDKGSYVYGEKELWYLNSIESKNMIATFKVSDRTDMPAIDEDGHLLPVGVTKQLDEINLYTKADFQNHIFSRPVKTVHFKYNHSLCKGTDPAHQDTGKLTLERVWFTYNGNEKGVRNPYIFNYNSNNPSYSAKKYDRWGNYKDPLQNPGSTVSNVINNAEYPYSLQDSTLAAQNAAAWTLDSIVLPSGGRMKIDYESDDYAYVQNKRAAQFFKIAGFSANEPLYLTDLKNTLYGSGTKEYLYVGINVPKAVSSTTELYTRYLEGMDTLFFRVYVKMPTDQFGGGSEYIPCYAILDPGDFGYINDGKTIWIKLQAINKAGEVDGDGLSPLARTAVQFLRANLPSKAYPGSETTSDPSPGEMLKVLFSQADNIMNAVQSYDLTTRLRGWVKTVDTSRSYVRLDNPYYKKYGGGLRVKRIRIYDHWNAMTKHKEAMYGQEYQYTTTHKLNGVSEVISSGVATFEPSIGGEENPWRLPIQYKEQAAVLAPVSMGYVEKPLGETFYPAPSVGYSKIRVRSLNTQKMRSASGYAETCFYTSYDFPTITDMTSILDNKKRFKPALANLLRINARHYMVISQGFKVELNDMNGKMKSQASYAETDPDKPISYTENYYRVDDQQATFKHLNNTVNVISTQGKIDTAASIGKDVELMMDMRQQESVTNGINFNVNGDGWSMVLPPFFFLPTLLSLAQREQTLFRSIGTTKIINRHGILDSVVVIDKGSRVVTRNMLYDGETGDVVLTSTQNEFNDPVYHFSWPAAWVYDGMSGAYKNIGVVMDNITMREGKIVAGVDTTQLTNYFSAGDEILIYSRQKTSGTDCNPDIATFPALSRIYALDANAMSGSTPDIYFMDRDGKPVSGERISLKIIRSGRRNISAAVGEVTLLANPISGDSLKLDETSKVISAAATEYQQFWKVADKKKAGTMTNCVQQTYAVYAGTNTCGPHYYGNDSIGGYFVISCSGSGTADSVLYSIQADAFSSTISKSDANAKANAELAVKGPIYASMNSTCRYNNVKMQRTYIRNNCPVNTIPDTVAYVVPAGKYSETTQEMANAKAAADTASNGQNYANTTGECRACNLFFSKKADSDELPPFETIVTNTSTGEVVFHKTLANITEADLAECYALPYAPYSIQIGSMETMYATIGSMEKMTDQTTSQTWLSNPPINVIVSTKPTPVYYNTGFIEYFVKNNCGTDSIGSSVGYPVSANMVTSSISVEDANAKAAAMVSVVGQANANANGTCVNATELSISQKGGASNNMAYCRVTVTNMAGTVVLNRIVDGTDGLPYTMVLPSGGYTVAISSMSDLPAVQASVNGSTKDISPSIQTWYTSGPPLIIQFWKP